MRIGLDARTIYRPQRRGTGRNLVDLYRALAALRPDWRVTAYHRQKDTQAELLPDSLVAPKLIEMPGDRFGAWESLRLPWAAWRDGVDLLHCPSAQAPTWMPTPTLVTIHDLIPLDMPEGRPAGEVRRFAASIHRACRSARWIVCPSAYTRDRLVAEFNADRSRITVNPWAPDSSMRFMAPESCADALARYGIRPPFVIHFGAPDPRKNTARVIDAWQRLPHQVRSEWSLLVIGLNEPMIRTLRERVESCEDPASIHLHGFADEADVPALMSAADVLAFPSLSEGFGLPIVDAWATRTAVLTANGTSLPEVAGDAAELIDPHDTDQIAAGLSRLMGDANRRDQLVNRGLARLPAFNWTATATRFAEAVEQAVGEKQPLVNRNNDELECHTPSRPPEVECAKANDLSKTPIAEKTHSTLRDAVWHPSIQSAHHRSNSALDVLIVSERPLWPLDQGFKVHGYHMARALGSLGANVRIASVESCPAGAPAWLRGAALPWPEANDADLAALREAWAGVGSWLRRRVAEHQGLEESHLAGCVRLARERRPRLVLGVGMHSVAMLRSIPQQWNAATVWYAADELAYFDLTCMAREPLDNWPARLRTLASHLALERAFAPGIDGAIGVSPRDTALLRRIAGARRAVTIRNGVDLDHFYPDTTGSIEPLTLAFWGRLDFEPNADAVAWFARAVWPQLLRRRPGARWLIAGRNPAERVEALRGAPGIELLGEVADVREVAQRASVVVLPMRCGGGIKNKLLEAAAMGKAIVASSTAVDGLDLAATEPPLMQCDGPGQWIETIEQLWNDPDRALRLGAAARAWVDDKHDWVGAAATLRQWLREELAIEIGCQDRVTHPSRGMDSGGAGAMAA